MPADRKKLDKIFDNTYEEKEFDSSNMTFKPDPAFSESGDPETEIHYNILFDEINALIQDSEFKKYNELDINGKTLKLNKVQINELYRYIITNISVGYRKMEIFSVLSEYFDIYPNKFYASLSNVYKNELLQELDACTDILNKKKIKRIF